MPMVLIATGFQIGLKNNKGNYENLRGPKIEPTRAPPTINKTQQKTNLTGTFFSVKLINSVMRMDLINSGFQIGPKTNELCDEQPGPQ